MAARSIKEPLKRERSLSRFPFSDIEDWFEEAWNRPFSLLSPSLWPDMRSQGHYQFCPSVDIYREGKYVILKTELPGIKKEDIKIDLTENVLTISGEKTKKEKIERKDYFRYERCYGSFCRKFNMPIGLDVEQIKAQFEDGVLEVKIPMTKEAEQKHKKIPIE